MKEQLLAQCAGLSYQRLAATQDFSALRWFHRHGVPQVAPLAQPLTTVEQERGIASRQVEPALVRLPARAG